MVSEPEYYENDDELFVAEFSSNSSEELGFIRKNMTAVQRAGATSVYVSEEDGEGEVKLYADTADRRDSAADELQSLVSSM